MDEVYIFPTSYAQRRLWFLDRLEPGSPFYNIYTTIQFTEPPDVNALKRALGEVVRRHESLRTTFDMLDGEPMQVISPARESSLPVVDLSGVPEAERAAEIERLSQRQYEQPFDLKRGPLMRATLVLQGDEEHLLLLTLHHIVSDGWSLRIFERELRAIYSAFRSGSPSPLPEVEIQYADYSMWQREWLTGEVLDNQLSYWREALKGAPTELMLPIDKPRPAVQSYRGAGQRARLGGAGLLESLRALGRSEGATLFMTLLAGFSALLSRYSGQEDVVVGTPVAGRNVSDMEGLIGFLVNTLAIRCDVSGEVSFREVVGRVREACLGAYTHQDVPFERLVEDLSPRRDPGRNPLFQVSFQLITADSPGVSAEEGPFDEAPLEDTDAIEGEESEIETGTTKFDLGLDVWETSGGLVAGIEYSTDLFEHDTIGRMLGHFRTLLEGAAAAPDSRLAELPILTAAEYRQQIYEWNATACDYPKDVCLQELFEAQAQRTPDAVAVVCEDGQLSYSELNARANQLAHYLRRLGVGPEARVSICLNRSPETIVALLGVLKSGAAYVPLDPGYPKPRLAFMIEDSGAAVMLTEQSLLASLPEPGVPTVCLDRDRAEIALESETDPRVVTLPENLAYIIYTSGSTGQPKGVMIQHRSLVNWTLRASAEYDLRPTDRVLQFSSISFDAAAEEIYPCLTLGGALVLRTDSMVASAEQLLDKCREFGVTVLDFPTAYWHELTWELHARNLRLPDSVRLVIFGGEKALPERLVMWRRSVREGVRLMHGYGPTEATVVGTIADLSRCGADGQSPREVPIGRPIGNAQAYVLDSSMRPVPVGVAGELYLGGDGLARGYLHGPALTAERFIPDPYAKEPGSRLYRTGDVVRVRAEGEIEFMGRADGQVKLRGFRIELGEIEAALRVHAGVRDAVAVVRDGAREGDKYLAAYVVTTPPDEPAQQTLRDHLGELLPAYMVPAAIVFMDALPLAPSGKVDRAALPDASALRTSGAPPFVKPETEAERLVTEVWQEVFGADRLSVDSNFFDLGGHSLMLIRIHGKLRDKLREEISLIDLFRYPTIRSLAAHLGRGTGPDVGDDGANGRRQIQERASRQREAADLRRQVARRGPDA